jgi:glycosyltransferase involved in cell wall biosynthesis
MISIVTGTLDRINFLPNLIENTVLSNEQLELILVDGGSIDGTIEYIKKLNHPRIKLIEVGKRSSYPHFMNLGIEHATHDYICQWNDDVIVVNSWNEIISEIDEQHDFYLFNWKYGNIEDINNVNWLNGINHLYGWCLVDNTNIDGEIVMNYGLYNKKIFREIGLYNDDYRYYYADGDMANRAYKFNYKHKTLHHIKVCSLITEKKATHYGDDLQLYNKNLALYAEGKVPTNLKYLK